MAVGRSYQRVTALKVFFNKEMYGVFPGPKRTGRKNEVSV